MRDVGEQLLLSADDALHAVRHVVERVGQLVDLVDAMPTAPPAGAAPVIAVRPRVRISNRVSRAASTLGKASRCVGGHTIRKIAGAEPARRLGQPLERAREPPRQRTRCDRDHQQHDGDDEHRPERPSAYERPGTDRLEHADHVAGRRIADGRRRAPRPAATARRFGDDPPVAISNDHADAELVAQLRDPAPELASIADLAGDQ